MDKKIAILYVIDGLFQGGKERQFVEILKGIDRNIFKIGIVTFNKNLFYSEQAKSLSDYFIELDKTSNKFKPFFTIWTCFRDFKPDIVHSWDYLSSLYVYLPSKLKSVKFINGSIRDSGTEKGWKNKLKKLMLKAADLVIANSKAGLESYNVKGEVIYNAVNTERFNYIEQNGEFNIIKVANFTDYKNHKMFIDAAVKLVDNKIVDKVFLAGDGIYKDKYLKYIQEKSKFVFSKFNFLGSVSNIETVLNKCKVGILCSTIQYSEGISNSVLEYMAAGLVPVATNIGASSEIIENTKNGYLVKADSADDLFDKIKFIKENYDAHNQMIINAKNTINTKFNYQNNIKKLSDLYIKNISK
ncbi:MAG: glycosyltransferase [Bacteroidales bacterium]|nr:glycosyltransferase [Bacteroidales bacterium]